VRNHHGIETSDWPTVSVVTLNWNGMVHLEPCYGSLRELDYPQDKLELVLVDNGSTDGSVEFMQQRFPEVKIIKNRTNLGFCKANNLGARAAQGKYVAFLNNDTHVHPAWLKELVAAVQEGEKVICAASKILTWEGDRIDFVGGNMNFHGMGSQPAYGSTDVNAFSEPRELLFACGGSMLIDREVFLDCGGFDEDFFIYYEDVDLGWRLWVLGYKVVFVPTAITYHRFHGDTGGWQDEKRITLTERNTLLAVIKNYSDENLARVLPAALMLMIERAFLLSKVDGQRYRLGVIQQEEDRNPLVGLGPGKSEALQDKIRRQGLWSVARRAARKAWRVICQRFILRFNRELEAVPRTSISPLVAAADVVRLLPNAMEKRAEIQRRRKRSDAELAPLFRQPFRPSLRHDLYEQVQNRIVDAFGIQTLFDVDMPAQADIGQADEGAALW